MPENGDPESLIAHLRDLVRLADLDSMETKELLKHQTRLMNALRENQIGMNAVLQEQGSALGGMVLAINGLQQRVSGMDKRLVNVEHTITGMDRRLTRVEDRLTGVEEKVASIDGRLTRVEDRLTGVEEKVASVDQNVLAIMRHLGV